MLVSLSGSSKSCGTGTVPPYLPSSWAGPRRVGSSGRRVPTAGLPSDGGAPASEFHKIFRNSMSNTFTHYPQISTVCFRAVGSTSDLTTCDNPSNISNWNNLEDMWIWFILSSITINCQYLELVRNKHLIRLSMYCMTLQRRCCLDGRQQDHISSAVHVSMMPTKRQLLLQYPSSIIQPMPNRF